MKTIQQKVSPAKAEEWITRHEQNGFFQRKLDPARVDLYATDMLQDNWGVTHQGIGLTEEGDIADGLTTLHAIKKSGKTIETRVTFGLPRSAMKYIDQGRPRSTLNVAHIAGLSWVNGSHTATLNSMLCGPFHCHVRLTKQQTLELIQIYSDALIFADGLFNRHLKGLSLSGTKGVFARAFYTENLVALTEFANLFLEGMFDPKKPGHVLIKSLRDNLLSGNFSGADGRVEVYQRTQNVLRSYLDQDGKKLARTTSKNLFPLTKKHTFDIKYIGEHGE